MFLLGMPFYVVFVQLPQRFQTVNFTSAQRAGILLLPATLVSPVGAMIAGLAAKRIPIEIVLILSAVVVTAGIGLLGSLPTYSHMWPGLYGYEVITGLGLGLASPPYFMLVATSVAEKDISVGTGALNMVRTLGGCVAVAICSALHREFLNDKLPELLYVDQIAAIGDSSGFVAHLPEQLRNRVGNVFGESYNKQFQIMLAFAGLNLIVTIILAIVRKKLGVFGKIPERKEGNEFMQASDEPNVSKRTEVDPTDSATAVNVQVANPGLKSDDTVLEAGNNKNFG
jgi:MFS family permease